MKKHFLQSQEWEEFQEGLGRKVFRIGGILVVRLPLTFAKSYLYSAGSETVPSAKKLCEAAAKENAVFFKFEPLCAGLSPAYLERKGFNGSRKEIQPQKTIILDIARSEEQLLAQMHQKTRYNIRLAQKKGLKFGEHKKGADVFWELLQKTTERDGFAPHSKRYYKNLLELPFVKLFVVEREERAVAASIVVFYEGRSTYLHGASDYEYRNLMAPYFLHWEAIRHAKERGFSEYDFWGIDEKKWPGVTRFKKGFGGREVEYAGSYDYVFQGGWYVLYSLRNRMRTLGV